MNRSWCTSFVSLLIIAQAALLVDGKCDKVSVLKTWRGGFMVKFNLPIPEAKKQWTMDIKFSSAVQSLQVRDVQSSTVDKTVFRLKNLPNNRRLLNGFELKVLHSPSRPTPDIVSVVFDGKEICSGPKSSLSNSTKSTAKQTTTTKKPTTKPTTRRAATKASSKTSPSTSKPRPLASAVTTAASAASTKKLQSESPRKPPCIKTVYVPKENN